MAKKLSYNYSLKWLLILTTAFALSCSKQESPTIETGEIRSQQEIERLEACSHVNFNTGVLLHQNALMLFKCTKWDQEFPHMYNAMKSIRQDSWDHLIKPIDQAFISDHTRRDRFFSNIRDLDSKNGLDDLSYVLVSLNETNFFDSTKAMFKCVENAGDPICLERQGRIPLKRSLKNIVSLIDIEQETIARASRLVRQLNKALGDNQESVRKEINKFRANPLYIPLRLKLIDAFAQKIKSGLTAEDRTFLSKIFLTGTTQGNEPWIYEWMQNSKMNRQKFRDLIEYPILVNPDFAAEFRGIEKAYDSNFSCTIKSSQEANKLITFDFKKHFYDYGQIIRNEGMKDFYDFASESMVGLKLSTEICRELEKNSYGVNLPLALSRLSQFLSEKSRYDLIKFLVTSTTLKGNPDNTFAQNLYLPDFATGNIFSTANALNSEISTSTREFYPLVYDILKNFPSEAYIDLGVLLEDAFKAENDGKAIGVADYWNFFTDEEKNFIFNFVDRHFDKETNYVLLFEFYSKFLDDLYDVQPLLKDSWSGTDEKREISYLTLQDFFYNLAGKETLLDFKKFFSRDHILRVLEVISNGQKIADKAKADLNDRYSDDYVRQIRTNNYQFKVTYNPGNNTFYDSEAVLDCMKKFNELDNGFYHLVRNLPSACTKITNENIAFRLYGWLNSVENSYLEFKKGSRPEDSLFNDQGLLSPLMLNTTIATTKLLDTILGPLDSKLPTKGGVDYLLESMRFHLVEKKVSSTIEKNIDLLSKYADINSANNVLYRNTLIRKFSDDDVFKETNIVLGNISSLSQQYAEWVKKGQLAEAQNRSLGKYDPKYSCAQSVNQVVSPYPCPSVEIIKKHTNGMLNYLTTIHDPAVGSPLSLLLKALKPDEGLFIPHNGKNPYKYRMSLKEMFQYFYDASDRNLKVNNMDMLFVNEKGQASRENVTTLERIETVIREVRFGNNYLGTAFLNGIVTADDYNEEAKERRKLLSRCLKIPGIRCARPMSKNDLRMGRNSLEAFDSLIDINNGRGLEPRLKYGDFLRTFETTLVASSAKNAQAVQLFPLRDELLLQHNGRLLAEMTLMTSWSNAARVIRDRVGRTRQEFETFINRDDFAKVDKALFRGFNLPRASSSTERLIKKIQQTPVGENENLLSQTIDWVSELNYDQTRLVEDTVARLMVIGAYLGSPEVVFEGKTTTQIARYKDNNLFQVFLTLEKLIDYWPTLKKVFPADTKFIDVIKPINTALVFFTDKLTATDDAQKNIAYIALNDLYSVLQTVLFDDMGAEDNTGINFIIAGLGQPQLVSQTYQVIRDDYKLLDHFHAGQAQFFNSAATNIKRVIAAKNIDLTPVRDYLRFTTKSQICLKGQTNCKTNYHYDEPVQLLKYLNKKSSSGETHFSIMTRKVLSENFDQLMKMLDDLLPCLKVKQINPPFAAD